jgi:sortase A
VIASSTSRIVEAACWVLGVALVTGYFSARAYGELGRRQAIAAFTETRLPAALQADAGRDDAPEDFGSPLPAGPPDQSAWSTSRRYAYAAAVTGLDGSELPVAVLRIASLAVEVPVYIDSSEHNLNRGAGLIAGTALPGSGGNVAIAAHRDGYFRALRNAAIGDVIELESRSEQTSYRITGFAIVEPTELWPLDDTDVPMVTLVTCYPFYFVGSAPQRFIVRAVAVN